MYVKISLRYLNLVDYMYLLLYKKYFLYSLLRLKWTGIAYIYSVLRGGQAEPTSTSMYMQAMPVHF